MRKVILNLIAFSFITGCLYSQAGWQILNSGVTADLKAVYFINSNTGYVCGTNGVILKTINGGINWNPLSSSVTTTLDDICFADEMTGYCCGFMGVIKTTDSGQSWSSISTVQANRIACPEGILYAATNNSVDKSTNQGTNWFNIMSPGVAVYGLYFVNSSTGYANGYNGLHRKTTNGGVNWAQGGAWFPGTYTFRDCYFPAAGPGYVLGSYNSGWPNYFTDYSIYRSNFAAGNYGPVHSSSTLGFNGISFGGIDTGYCVGGNNSGQSLIMKTINGGSNWAPMDFNLSTVLLLDVFFLNSTTGYITGRNGTIIKTTSGGITGIHNISGNIPESYSLSQNYPNPFNPITNVEFRIPKSGFVNLTIYDAMGRVAETLVNSELKLGTFKADWDASRFVSGVYFYKLTASNFTQTKKMVLIK